MYKCLLLSLPLLLFVSPAIAEQQVELSFPLGGHYRPGRFLPVRIVAKNTTVPVRIEAAGGIPTEMVPVGGSIDAVVPLLAVTTLKEVRWSAGAAGGPVSVALTPLSDHERLVGVAAADVSGDAFTSPLFPGSKLISVPLDPAAPFQGAAVAWGALDAVLLDAAAAARVTEPQLATLLASGTTVAVRSAAEPGGDAPWRRHGAWWVAAPELAGPSGLIEPMAYEPVAAWNPGWPASFRRATVLTLIAFSIVAVALTLWRSRYATLAIVAVALITVGGLIAWRAGATSTRTASGVVRVDEPGWSQVDSWTYRRGLLDNTHVQDAVDVTRPVFASRRHFERSGMTLHAGDSRTPPRFRYRLETDHTIAFLHRRVEPPRQTDVAPGKLPSPMRGMAQQLYLRRGDRIAGTFPATLPDATPDDYELWPGVVVETAATAHPVTPTPAPAAAGAGLPR